MYFSIFNIKTGRKKNSLVLSLVFFSFLFSSHVYAGFSRQNSITAHVQDVLEDEDFIKTNSLKNEAKDSTLRELLREANTWQSSEPSKALDILRKGLYLINEKETDLLIQATFFHSLGITYFYLNEFDKSLTNFFSELELRKKIGDEAKLATCYNAIGNVFFGSGDLDNAISYFNQSLDIKREIGDLRAIETTLANLGSLYIENKNYEQARLCLSEALESAEARNDKKTSSTLMNILGTMYTVQEQYDSALQYNFEALANIENEEGMGWQKFYIINSITRVYIYSLRLDEAKIYLDKALNMLNEINTNDMALFVYRNAMHYYSAKGDLDNHLLFYSKYDSIRDIIFTEEKSRQLIETQIKYETEETAKENALHKLQLAQKAKQQYFYIFGLILALILFLIIYYRYRSRLRINAQLEHMVKERTNKLIEESNARQLLEQQLLSIAIETEERERTSFAEELHDSLGPLLSTIRIYTDLLMSELNEKNVNSDNVATINDLLKDAVQTAKEIANKLMPSILNDFGLIDTIKNFVDNINKSKIISIKLDAKSMNQRFDPNIEKAFYRITSELITNTIKHARAENITISFRLEHDELFFDYKDDGIGFDASSINIRKKNHNGLTNVFTRMKAINAFYELYSEKGKGIHFFAKVYVNYYCITDNQMS